jgi:single-stranded DNA-binding protein
MLYMTAKGTLVRHPEKKISVNGVPYLRFQIDIPAPQGKWPARVYCTAFNEMANEFEHKLYEGMLVEVQGTPGTSAYTNKMGKPSATLQCITRRIVPLTPPVQIAQPQGLPQALPETNLTDEDVPF